MHSISRLVHTVCAGVAFVTVAAGAANAQVTDPVLFKTAFSFTAGSTVLPAGSYRIEAVDDDPHMLLITSEKPGKTGAFVETEDATPAQEMKKTEVVFKRYGDQYVLKTIWLEGEETGATVTTTRAEQRHAKHATASTDEHVAAVRGKGPSLAKK